MLQPDLSATAKGYFSQRRIEEATILSMQLSKQTADQQAQITKTIRSLLSEYIAIANEQLPIFNNHLDKNQLPPQPVVDFFQKFTLHEYVELENLRLVAPPDAQGKVLRAEAVTQESLASLSDAQNLPPVSPEDVREFTQFVTTGFISQSEMENILSAKSNRELYHVVDQQVQAGILPATALPALSYDQMQTYLPNDSPSFRSHVEFNELRKIILLTLVIEPTAEQKIRIQKYLQSYTIGKPIPTDDIRPFVAPLIYGITLSTQTDAILKYINPNMLTPSRREIYIVWQHVNKEQLSTKEAFTQLFKHSNTEISHDSSLLERIQLEGLNALQENVVYLAFPPGWTKDMVLQIRDSFPTRIALLKQTEKRNAVNQKLNTDLIQSLSYFSKPFTDAAVETTRTSFFATIFSFEQNLIASAYSPQYSQPMVDQKIDTLQKNFLTKIDNLKKTNSSQADIAELEKSLDQIIPTLHLANADLQQQQSEQKSFYKDLGETISKIAFLQNQYKKQIGTLLSGSSPIAYPTQTTYTQVQNQISKNTSSLQNVFTLFTTAHAELQKQFTLSAILSYQQLQLLQGSSTKISLEDTVKKQIQQDVANIQSDADTTQKNLENIVLTFDTRFYLFLQALINTNELVLQKITLAPVEKTTLDEILSSSLPQQEAIGATIATQLQDTNMFYSSLITLGQSEKAQQMQFVPPTNSSALISVASTLIQSREKSQTQIDALNGEWSSLPTSFSFTLSDFDKIQKALDDHFAKLADQLDVQYRQYQNQLNADIQRLRETTNQEIIRMQQKAKDLQKDLESKTPIQVETVQTTASPTSNPTIIPTIPPTAAPTAVPSLPGNSGNAPGHNK